MKKGIGFFLLSAGVLFSLCGCGNQQTNATKNAITKDELVGTWLIDGYEITFEKDGTFKEDGEVDGTYELIGNWIVLDDYSLYYEYIDGKLYTSDSGGILRRK